MFSPLQFRDNIAKTLILTNVHPSPVLVLTLEHELIAIAPEETISKPFSMTQPII